MTMPSYRDMTIEMPPIDYYLTMKNSKDWPHPVPKELIQWVYNNRIILIEAYRTNQIVAYRHDGQGTIVRCSQIEQFNTLRNKIVFEHRFFKFEVTDHNTQSLLVLNDKGLELIREINEQKYNEEYELYLELKEKYG